MSTRMISIEPDQEHAGTVRLYSLCLFDRGWMVPQMQFLEAENDQSALALATSIMPWMTREIWDRHRLVSILPPTVEMERL